jgi:hypothetical protein
LEIHASPTPADDLFEGIQSSRVIECRRESGNETPDASQIDAGTVQDEQALDVLLVLWTERDCLVDDQILGARNLLPYAGNIQRPGGGEGIELERQPANRQVDIHTARFVTKEEHLMCVGEAGGVLDARHELVSSKTFDQR